MKYKEILYSETFPLNMGTGAFRKLHLVAELEENESPKEAFYKCMREVRNFHHESIGADKKKEEQKSQDQEVGLEAQIKACTSVPVLETFKLLVRNNDKLNQLYREKLVELSNK